MDGKAVTGTANGKGRLDDVGGLGHYGLLKLINSQVSEPAKIQKYGIPYCHFDQREKTVIFRFPDPAWQFRPKQEWGMAYFSSPGTNSFS
jgi:hypothetical protein